MTKLEKQNEIQGRNKSSLYLELSRIGSLSKLFIHNIKSVEQFTNTDVILKLNKGAIRISGKELLLSVYENASVEVDGVITAVVFI